MQCCDSFIIKVSVTYGSKDFIQSHVPESSQPILLFPRNAKKSTISFLYLTGEKSFFLVKLHVLIKCLLCFCFVFKAFSQVKAIFNLRDMANAGNLRRILWFRMHGMICDMQKPDLTIQVRTITKDLPSSRQVSFRKMKTHKKHQTVLSNMFPLYRFLEI